MTLRTEDKLATLYRPDNIENIKPTKVIIIGNGAVKKGWDPLVSAVYESDLFTEIHHLPKKDMKRLIDLIPAQTIHQYNIFRNLVVTNGVSDLNNDVLEKIKTYFYLFFCFINNIGDNYKNKELQFNHEIKLIENEVNTETGVVTLNYDDSVWNHKKNGVSCFQNLMYLHGRGIEPESIYFPTDNTATDRPISITNIIEDQKIKEYAENSIKKTLQKLLNYHARFLVRRTNVLTDEYNKMHRTCINWIQNASEIVIWGLCLNPYDAELTSIIFQSALTKTNVKMKVINTSKEVAEKTRILFNISRENFTLINPKSFLYRIKNGSNNRFKRIKRTVKVLACARI